MNIQVSSKTVLAFINSEAAQPVVFDHALFAENLHNGFHAKSVNTASVQNDSVTFVCDANISAFGAPFTRIELVVPATSVVAMLNQQVMGAKRGNLIFEKKTIRVCSNSTWGPGVGTITNIVVEGDAVIFVADEKGERDLERKAIEAGAFTDKSAMIRARRQQKDAGTLGLTK